MSDHHDHSYRFQEYSGGCQCGAVRWHATEVGDNPHICHCRMCQKAMGNLFADLVRIKAEHLSWTRGQPSEFNSSDLAARGFCSACGTPLYYRSLSGPSVSMTIASFDTPHAIPIRYEMGLEGRHPSLRPLPDAEQVGTTEEADGHEQVEKIRTSSHQHPDHDTAEWPPQH